jgi:hypothetical protein
MAGRVTGPVDWAEAVQSVIDRFGASVRHGAPMAADFFVGASPGYFDTEDGLGHFNMDRVKLWAETTLAAFHKRYPRMVAAARLDLDEGSPHLAICVVPIYTKKTKRKESLSVSYRKLFGGDDIPEARQKMIALQDWYAEQMAPLGLTRGVPKTITGRKHQSHQEYARRRQAEDDAREKALLAAEEHERTLQLRVQEYDARITQIKASETLARSNHRKATKLLLEAEEAHKWVARTADALSRYDPDAPVATVLAEKSAVFEAHRLQVEALKADLAEEGPAPTGRAP